MSYPNPSTALASVVMDELARAGAGLVVASPGSRSTALVLAAAARADLDLVVAIDERSAGFHALGWAKATGRPGVVITTSGTAVANLMPAVVEADAAGLPLMVLSSDRPPELRGVGANQTIEQPGMFGGFMRTAIVLGPAEDHPDAPRWWRSTMSQAVGAAVGWQGRPGPVQVDAAFREPTVGVSHDGRVSAPPFLHDQAGRPDGRIWTETAASRHPSPAVVDRLGGAIARTRRGLILAGSESNSSAALADLGAHLGWPVVATAESGLRRVPGVVATGHHLLAADGVSPDLVVRFGSPGPSRRLIDLVSGPIPQIVVGRSWSDPGRVADLVVDDEPAALASALIEAVPGRDDGEWVSWWVSADAAVRGALGSELAAELTEPAVAAAVPGMGGDLLLVGSSMPIRDVEAYAFDVGRLVANRGASGIDGMVSTALGASWTSESTLALLGDISLLHDANGFLCDPRPDCVFLVVDNSGGGIFSFLPQAEHVGADFERLFATPPNRDLSVLAEFHGLRHRPVDRLDDLGAAVREMWAAGGCGLVVVKTDRADNVTEHRRLESVAAEAISAVGRPHLAPGA